MKSTQRVFEKGLDPAFAFPHRFHFTQIAARAKCAAVSSENDSPGIIRNRLPESGPKIERQLQRQGIQGLWPVHRHSRDVFVQLVINRFKTHKTKGKKG